MSRVLTVTEAAAHVGRSRHFVTLLIADGQVAARKTRGRWYVNAASLDDWARCGTTPTPPAPLYTIPAEPPPPVRTRRVA